VSTIDLLNWPISYIHSLFYCCGNLSIAEEIWIDKAERGVTISLASFPEACTSGGLDLEFSSGLIATHQSK
jgi:hypothetical protein